MPLIAALSENDPAAIGGYELKGRLGEGGQGVVYLGAADRGQQVAIKWLRPHLAADATAAERFAREAAAAQRVAPFCTAKVLATGVHDRRPYIISEFVDGRSLHRAVTEEGPRTESALHRLAIGSVTALAAIHQAGIVHRDFSPNNVLLAAEGPRVIDFGIAKALDATSTITSMPVGTPAFMAPEQILAHPVGPAADMFAWASTMVYAASGVGPFSAESVPATIHRVLYTEPDLRSLTGPLRDLVAASLSKDPARRPTAEQVILRLLEQPNSNPAELRQAAALVSGNVPPQPQWAPPSFQPPPPGPYGMPAPMPPRRGNRGFVVAGIAAGLAIVATVVVVGVALRNLPEPRPTAASPSASRPATSPTPSPVPTSGLSSTKLPGTTGTIYEHPSDPVRLTGYSIYDPKTKEWTDYPRDSLTGPFKRRSDVEQILLSPDGRYQALRTKHFEDGYDAVEITDQVSGEKLSIRTTHKPQNASLQVWSRDSRRILVNIGDSGKDGVWQSTGFGIVDVTARDFKPVTLREGALRGISYGFDDRQSGVIVMGSDSKTQALRFFDEQGTSVRRVPNVGAGLAKRLFSPSGGKFATDCPGFDNSATTCVFDTRTGAELKRLESQCEYPPEWFDEEHVMCWAKPDAKGSRQQLRVLDMSGTMVRLLADVPVNADNVDLIYYATKG
ncbi:serine/threonine protein kinase [Nonomuraea sediminis]|uniref:serine/threonine protein kinase n=1 Tax=Nonomuraea sediminis TaxID=2835864 RepID=UPI001BDC1E4C|nr:serine/threonine-protein kinase [Nonomuraea sediminis]